MQPDWSQYLRRIGAVASPGTTLDDLARLQRQHLLTVPFENHAVMAREPIRLDIPALFHKVVDRRRGGFCFELNGLFAGLLRRLGFEVDLLCARVYQAAGDDFGPPFDHLTLRVWADGAPYLIDVGFGDSCRLPLPLPHGEAQDVGGAYRVDSARRALPNRTGIAQDDLVLLRKADAEAGAPITDTSAEWIPKYLFTSRSYALEDFAPMCAFHGGDPASIFGRRLMCSLATPTGRVTLSNDRLIITRGPHRHESAIHDAATRRRILAAYFGVKI